MTKVISLGIPRKAAPTFHSMVDEAMQEMIEKLCACGLDRCAVALTLADAADDYVIALASGNMARQISSSPITDSEISNLSSVITVP
ncbi:MAG TPA: hypothetical protein VGC14_12650 [Rhizobium sp.]